MFKITQDMMSHYRLPLVVVVLAIVSQCIALPARASVELDFSRFTSNSPTDVAQYLRVVVSEVANVDPGIQVLFDVSWAADTLVSSPELVDASIKKVWIMDGLLDGGVVDVIETDIGVDFEATINDPNFPNANSLNFSATFTYESTTEGKNSYAVQPGESVGFEFTLKAGYVFQDVVDAIFNVDSSGNIIDDTKQTIRVALHVGTLDDGDGSTAESDKFMNTPVPEPGSFLVWLTLAALGMVVSYRPKL